MTKSALLVVDVQNDFISGTLSLSNCPSKHDGGEVVPLINNLTKKTNFDLIVFTQDWHPTDHISFFDNVHLRTFHHSCPKSPDEVKVGVCACVGLRVCVSDCLFLCLSVPRMLSVC